MKQEGTEEKYITKLEPFTQRYRRAVEDIDPRKLSCTLKMRVSHKKWNVRRKTSKRRDEKAQKRERTKGIERIYRRANERTSERTGEQTNERENERMNELINE